MKDRKDDGLEGKDLERMQKGKGRKDVRLRRRCRDNVEVC